MSKGYVYIIKPHLKVGGRPVVRIGRTTRSPRTRLRELTTALPSGASLSYWDEFPDVKWAEAWLHEALGNHRVAKGGGTEFFYLSVTEAKTIVQTLAHKVSEVEARAALERDLDSYLDTLTVFMLCVGWAIISLFLYRSFYADTGSSSFSLGLLVVSLLLSVPAAGFVVYPIADLLNRRIVKHYFRADVVRERERLLIKYPAAKKTARLMSTRQGELDL
jgi:T5orf172 domain